MAIDAGGASGVADSRVDVHDGGGSGVEKLEGE
jgi:hypothetical protein